MKKDIMNAIKAKCLDCCCGQTSEIRECTIVKCPLHPFRLGKDPFAAKREISEEQKVQFAERMKKYRQNNKGE